MEFVGGITRRMRRCCGADVAAQIVVALHERTAEPLPASYNAPPHSYGYRGFRGDAAVRHVRARDKVRLRPSALQEAADGGPASGVWSSRRCISSNTFSCSHRLTIPYGLGVHCGFNSHFGQADGQ